MDIEIHTSDPDLVDGDEIREAIEKLGYFVEWVTVIDRGL